MKKDLLNIFTSIQNIWIEGNKQLLVLWKKGLDQLPNSTNPKSTKNRLLILLDNPAIALLLNTILFWLIGSIFGGLIGQIMFGATFINILFFCLQLFKK